MGLIAYGDIPAYHATRRPPATLALAYPDARLTWRELARRVNQRARLFASHGVGQDDVVTIAVPNSALAHEACFAAWKLGATANMISSRFPRIEFEAVLDTVQPKLVFGGETLPDGAWPQIPGNADIGGFDDAHLESRIAQCWRAQASGGSTGRPKIIVDRSPAAQDEAQLLGFPSVMRMTPGGVILNPGPLYHTAPFTMTHHGLFAGATIIGMARFDPLEALRLMDVHRVDWVTVVPTMMSRIWNLPEAERRSFDLSALKHVWHVGAPCSAELKRAWIEWLGPERVWELYAGTERLGVTTISGTDWLARPGSVGRTIDGRRIVILHEDGSICAPGEVGEVRFAIEPGAEPSHYLGDAADRVQSGLVGYGDLGHVDTDGFLYIADRRTDLILRGGANVYPAEVEAAVSAFPGVAGAVAIGLPDPDLGQRVHAIVEPSGGRPDLGDLHHFVSQRLAAYKLPESYEFVAGPLRDEAGKVRRSALRQERIGWRDTQHPFQQWAPRP